MILCWIAFLRETSQIEYIQNQRVLTPFSYSQNAFLLLLFLNIVNNITLYPYLKLEAWYSDFSALNFYATKLK